MTDAQAPCSFEAFARGEPLLGTAPRADVWVLVEVDGKWPADVFAEGVPAAVRRAIEAAAPAGGAVRVQAVRRPHEHGPVRVGVALAERAWLGWRTDASLEAVARAPWSAWLAAPEQFFAPSAQGVALACTHGRRDACCARHGVALWRALEAAAPGAALQSSHLGGHRFAPTVVWLPWGECFGRVPLEHAGAWLEALRAGRLPALAGCRGRSTWPAAAQVAAAAVRGETGCLGLGDVRVEEVSVSPDDGARAVVRVAVAAMGTLRVEVERRTWPHATRASCGLAEREARAYWVPVRILR